MLYRLTVEKLVENPNYATERKCFEAELHHYEAKVPEKVLLDKSLVVDLTEAEFQAVKKATLEVM